MNNLSKPIVLMGVLVAMLASLGCQQQMKQEEQTAPAGPMFEGYHRPRNPYFLPRQILAMESDQMHRLARAQGEEPGQRPLAWYDMRNDGRLSVESGYQSRTFETIYTRTYDRQYQHGNHIHDHYSQTTWRGSISETVR